MKLKSKLNLTRLYTLPLIITLGLLASPCHAEKSAKEVCLESGENSACLSYANKLVGDKQWSEAEPILEKLCDRGSMQSCLELIEVYGLENKNSKALKLAKRMCSEKLKLSGKACLKVYVLARKNGQNKSAEVFRKKACSLGEKQACTN